MDAAVLVANWIKPTNTNCRETGLRSLVTNNCGHSRTKSDVSPKITFYGRLHVIAYRATLDVPPRAALVLTHFEHGYITWISLRSLH
jgi:hypothetical protein